VSTRNRAPSGGAILTSGGQVFQNGDRLAFQERYDLTQQIIKNGAVEIGRRCTVPSAQSTAGYYYALDIPQGRELFIWQRDLFLSEGLYEIDLVVAPDGWTAGNEAFKRQLRSASTPTVQSELFCGVTLNNPENVNVIMQLPFVDTGEGQGNRRVGGAAAAPGALTALQANTTLIRVKRTTSAEFRTSILLIAWEEDA
jgi:hypothetical protein